MGDDHDQLRVECDPVPVSLASVTADFEALQPASECPYLTLRWLQSWAAAYEPRRLLAIRVLDTAERVVAVAVLEELRWGRLRFAGAPVTPVRGLLCAPGRDVAAWSALTSWFAGQRRSRWLEASGLDASVATGRSVVVVPLSWLSMQLPGNFDAFLAARPPRIRSNLRRRLRIAEREGLEAHPAHAGARAAAIDAFVRLHRERARAKREAHPNIDWRLAELLVRLGEHQTPRLSVMTLQRDGDAIAVGLAMEQGTADWFYNFGFDPSVAKLSPGVVLGLASIRAAIARGATRCDFGPGDARYKRDLGGEPVPRIRLEATSASLSGQVHRAGAVVRRQMRDVSVVREAREKGLRVTAPSRTARDGMLTPSWRSHRHPG